MEETAILDIQCLKCQHRWKPFGWQKRIVPQRATVTCPKCGFVQDQIWGDEETRKKYYQKELGLINDNQTEINELNKKIQLLQDQYDLEKKKGELFDKRMAQIENWKNNRERDFQIIEEFAKQIEDENQFKEDNK